MNLKKINEQTDVLDKKIENPDTGREVKVSTALSYDDETKVHQIAQQMVDNVADNNGNKEKSSKKNPRSHKAKVEKIGLNKEIFDRFKHLKLNAYPSANVRTEDVKMNTEGDLNSHWVLSWVSASTGYPVRSYTKTFLEANAKLKWERVRKMKPKHIEKINDTTTKLLKSKDPNIADAAAIINIIANTGLRVGNPEALEDRENRGVSTLGPNNITIEGNKVILNFIGKSHQENNSEFESKEIADYLRKRIAENKNEKTIFHTPQNNVDDILKKIVGKEIKVKDLRTYAATKMASEILQKDEMPPPPVPDKEKEIKKLVKKKLKNVFEQVSMKLNNTPAMAKSSYVDPHVIQVWLKNLGIKPKIIENYFKLKFLFAINEAKESVKLNPEDVELCDQYPLPNWWDDDNVELVKIK